MDARDLADWLVRGVEGRLLAAGVEPWVQLPLRLPAETAVTLWNVATDRARRTSLTVRAVAETVADTWAWWQTLAVAPLPPRDCRRPGCRLRWSSSC